jgi:hypothetical protein
MSFEGNNWKGGSTSNYWSDCAVSFDATTFGAKSSCVKCDALHLIIVAPSMASNHLGLLSRKLKVIGQHEKRVLATLCLMVLDNAVIDAFPVFRSQKIFVTLKNCTVTAYFFKIRQGLYKLAIRKMIEKCK